MSLQLAAQNGKYGNTPEDSINCVKNLSVYKDFLRDKDFKGAKRHWDVAFATCPKSSLKMYVDGIKILKAMAKENKGNKERVNVLADSMLLVYDQRIANFGKEGYVLGRKGSVMYRYKRPSLEEAFATLEKSIDLQKEKSEAAVLLYYFKAAVKMDKTTKKSSDEWVAIFTKCADVINYNLANMSDKKKLESYVKAWDNIIQMAEPYFTCDIIVPFFEARFEKYGERDDWLKRSAAFMEQRECDDSDIYFKIANTMHNNNPSSQSARSMGIMALKKKDYSKASGFFKQAIGLLEQEQDDENLDENSANLELLLAKSYFGSGDYSSARVHAKKAASHKSGWGEPYMLIGDMYAASISKCSDETDGKLKTPYWVAIDMYRKAKSVDPAMSDNAGKKIAQYSQYFPAKSDAFFYNLTEGSDYTVGCWINETTKVRVK